MTNRSFLVSTILAGGLLASSGLAASALPVPVPHDAIVNVEAAPSMVEKAYWHRGWHRHHWHRHYRHY